MKILHINYSDSGGGAAIAAFRHHQAMLANGLNSTMLVSIKKSKDPNIFPIKKSTIKNLFFKILNRILYSITDYYAVWSNNVCGYDVSKNKLVRNSDIVIIHWIGLNTLSIRSIEKILKTGKPVYMFMHDMWAITGGCHHSLQCQRYKTHCMACPLYHQLKGSKCKRDFSFYQFNEKYKRLAPYENLRFITPSDWLANCVKQSALFSTHSVDVVRNIIDLTLFTPKDKRQCRKELNLPENRKLLLFGADHITSPYKGWNLLENAINDLDENIEAVIYGKCPENLTSQLKIKCHVLGHISDSETLINIYSACDVFVSTSIAENYPNVLIEAMACGLPCIGTRIGGIPEIIEDSYNGFLIPELTADSVQNTLTKFFNLGEKEVLLMRRNAINSIQLKNTYSESSWKCLFN